MTDDLADAFRKYLQTQRDELTAAMERVFEAHHDQPVSEVMMALRVETDRLGLTITDEDLRKYAEVISGGQRIVFELG